MHVYISSIYNNIVYIIYYMLLCCCFSISIPDCFRFSCSFVVLKVARCSVCSLSLWVLETDRFHAVFSSNFPWKPWTDERQLFHGNEHGHMKSPRLDRPKKEKRSKARKWASHAHSEVWIDDLPSDNAIVRPSQLPNREGTARSSHIAIEGTKHEDEFRFKRSNSSDLHTRSLHVIACFLELTLQMMQDGQSW